MIGTSALIPAAGRGRRFGRDFNKVLEEVAGKPILAHTLTVFQESQTIDDIVLVCGKADVAACEAIVRRFDLDKVTKIVEGGAERQESVRNGLLAIDAQTEIVVIHDGARPFVNERIIAESAGAAELYGAAIAAVSITDTVKSADDDGFAESTLPREKLYAVQTPQSFRKQVIWKAHEKARDEGYMATDDAALVEHMGLPVKIIQGSKDNIKVTEPQDMEYLQTRLSASPPKTRCGFGYDIHRFASGRPLFLGGVEFPGEQGLEGHSDADVLLHAVCDALLGAIGAGDIGVHFPNTDPQYQGISSMELLSQTVAVLQSGDWSVVNVDVTLVAQKPKIASHAQRMKANISSVLCVREEAVNVKATTAEGLGAIGRDEGICCYAVANVVRTE